MSEFVMMPKADYEAACNSIRAKTGKTELIKSGAMSTEIDSITGGGSSDDVRYVTFMSYDGTTEYGKKAVAVGDDCADPIARGVFDTPTRESTAQYDYSFYGWATTPNGAADANWNKAVTEDRTVYANFAAVLRYYTITYYDSDGTTVLKTESLAYGSMPEYVPEKSGFSFDGWEPALSEVTGNASYTAKWAEKITFAGGSWEDIVRIAESGEAQNYFAIGDEKHFTYADPSGAERTSVLRIVGFNHDDLADGSGKAAMSMVTFSADFQAKMMDTYNSRYNGWDSCNLRTKMNGSVLSSFPEELRDHVKLVTKVSAAYGGTASAPKSVTTDDRVWLLSWGEIRTDLPTAQYGIAMADGPKYDGINYVNYELEFTSPFANTDGKFEVNLRSGYFNAYSRNIVLWCPTANGGNTVNSSTNAYTAHPILFGFCI